MSIEGSQEHAKRTPCAAGTAARLHHMFESMVRTCPEQMAASDGTRNLTYGQLDSEAEQFAKNLRRAGVYPGEVVALAYGRTTNMLAAAIGVLKAGAIYLPLDVNLPLARLQLMLEDSQPALIVCDLVGRQKLGVAIDDMMVAGMPWPERDRACGPVHAGGAYCIYTSGSTGQPRGVIVSHASICNLVEHSRAEFSSPAPGAQHSRNASLWTSFGFDVSVFEMFVPLCMGACVHLVPDDVRTHPLALLEWLVVQRIEFAYLPPFFMRRLVDFSDEQLGALQLRSLLVGVEPLNEAQLHRLQRALPGLIIVNGYGPTEATVYCTSYRDISCQDRTAPIGRAIAGVRVYLLDDKLEKVIDGECGEIFIAGACLADGYLRRADLTAERFLPDPFGSPGSRMYRTGDLARLQPSGDLRFVGRNDNQIKLNGYRVELGEVDDALSRCEGVLHAATIVEETQGGGKRLVAYAVPQAQAQLDPAELTARLRRQLPDYMVPSQVVLLEEFPLNANGKLDRAALPRPSSTGLATFVAPSTGLEVQLAQIWAEVLQLDRVGVHDGFRHLGGSSMQAVEISFRVSRLLAFRGRIPMPLGNISISEYAASVEQVLKTADTAAAARSPLEKGDRHPFSYAQQQVWFVEQTGEAWRAYRFHAKFRLRGALQAQQLRSAINQLIARHPLLRTRFLNENDTLQCELLKTVRIDLPLIDLGGLSPELRETRLSEEIRKELDWRFDTAQAPLARWVLIRLSDDEHVLVQSEHHNVHDGQSMRILIADLAALYSAACRNSPPQLPEIEGDYRSFSIEEGAWLASSHFEDQRDKWLERLRTFSDIPRLFGHRKPLHERSFRGAQWRETLSQTTFDRVNACAARIGVSRYVLMLAVFGVLCSRHNGRKRFLIGGALANRASHCYQWTVGMFVNMVPLPFDMERCERFEDVALALSEATDFAVANSGVPLAEIVKGLQLTQRLKGESPFNVSFSFHDSMPAKFDFEGLDVTLEEGLSNGSAKFDLSVVGILGNGSAGKAMELVFGYNTDLFDEPAVSQLVDHYTRLLEAVVADPHSRLCDLPLLTPDEQRQLQAWNATEAPYPDARCVHELFEDQAARTPQAVALVFEQQQLSYAELNRRANQLAHRLQAQGVGPDTLVAICVERSIEMVVGLLGVLKAGGAYVPLDPEYPAERLAYMLQDCAAPIVLTQSHLLQRLPAQAGKPICLDSDTSLQGQPAHNPAAPVRPQHLAYCIYTSGSTGRPKGVQLSHGAVVNRLRWMQDTYRLTADDRLLQKTSLGFDVSVWELFWTLGFGARLVIPRLEEVRDLDRLADRLVESRITFVHFTPAVLEQMLQQPNFTRHHSLRFLVSGGETLRLHQFRQAHALMGSAFHNRYGPTEAAINATCWTASEGLAHRETSVGRPVPNTRIYLLDEDLRAVPPGVPGEIFIAGAGLARGYLHRPDLTAEAFVPDPFGPAGTRMYRSGDFGRHLPSGDIEFLGRIDQQVKLRGYRIELGEIESALLSCEGVREAAVILAAEQMQLVAYLLPEPGYPLEIPAMRRSLQAHLPDHMLPTAWVFLDTFPLNPNGKVDRAALPRPSAEPTHPSQPVEGVLGEEFTPTVAAVIELMRSIAGESDLTLRSDFFEAGFHSINLMRLVAKCRSKFGVDLSIVETIDAQNPLAFALLIDQKLAAEAA